jgi:integrase
VKWQIGFYDARENEDRQEALDLMAKRPVSHSQKPVRKLRRVDPKRALQYVEFERLKAWAESVVERVQADTALDHLLVRNAVIVLVLLGTAARRFELCGFQCSDFYEVNGEPFAHLIGKGNIEAEIPIADETWRYVQFWLTQKASSGEPTGKDAPLFCGRNCGHLSLAQLNHIWDAVLALAGVKKIEDVGVHAARHTAGMLFLRATNSLPKTADFMRHSSDIVTRRFYAHVLTSDVRAGLNKMAEKK